MDGASVNMGKYTCLDARLKELAPWITVVHCFSHRLELAAAGAFNATFFANWMKCCISSFHFIRSHQKGYES